jgi:hypothetical protein
LINLSAKTVATRARGLESLTSIILAVLASCDEHCRMRNLNPKYVRCCGGAPCERLQGYLDRKGIAGSLRGNDRRRTQGDSIKCDRDACLSDAQVQCEREPVLYWTEMSSPAGERHLIRDVLVDEATIRINTRRPCRRYKWCRRWCIWRWSGWWRWCVWWQRSSWHARGPVDQSGLLGPGSQ